MLLALLCDPPPPHEVSTSTQAATRDAERPFMICRHHIALRRARAGVARLFIVDGWGSAGKHGFCHGPTFQGVPPFMLGGRALCLNALKRDDFPIGLSLRLEGRSSVLGISPTRYDRGAPPP